MGLYIIGNHQFILQACHGDMIIYLCSVLWSYRVWQQFMQTHEIRRCDVRLLMYVLLLATINVVGFESSTSLWESLPQLSDDRSP